MKKLRTGIIKKTAVLLVFTALFSLFAVTAYGADKTITGLGTGAIGNPTVPANENSAWRGSFVYYGKYDGTNPTKYRVLDKASTDFGVSGGSLLLNSNSTLYNAKFDEDGSANSPATKADEWAYSDVKRGLNGGSFLAKEGNLTAAESAAIAESTKAAASGGDGTGKSGLGYASLSGDKIFLLDAKEVTRSSYGYSGTYGFYVENRRKSGSESWWWLRSPLSRSDDTGAGIVANNGAVDVCYVGIDDGVSPAFNVNLSSVIFSSLVYGTAGQPGAEYKLTLSDNKIEIKVPEGEAAVRSANTLTIPYAITGEHKDNASLVSVLVTDKNYYEEDAEVLQYGELSVNGAFRTSGTGTFTLAPENSWEDNYHIYILAEDLRNGKETDYASTPFEIRPGKKKVSANVIFKVEYGCWDDGSAEDKTVILSRDEDEDLALVLNSDQIPAVGSKPADGFKAGSWDTVPSTNREYTENTTTTYTYIYAQDGDKPEPTEYSISVAAEGPGTVSADRTSAKAGEKVNLTAMPESGAHFKEWKVTPDTVVIKDNSFTMPDSDVTVKAVFEKDITPPEPTPTEPTPPEPTPTEPTPPKPTPTEPTPPEPTPPKPTPTEPTPPNPTPVEPTPAEPTPQEPTPSEPTPPEPTPPEPTPPEPVPSKPITPETVVQETYKAVNLNGLTIAGLSLDIRLYGHKNTVSYNGRTHVAKGTALKGKNKNAADLDIGVEGIPGFVAAKYVYGNTRNASEGKAWFTVRLNADKASPSYNALNDTDRKKLGRELKKINKTLKKKENRVFFSIKPLDLGEFKYDGSGSGGGKLFVRKDGSGDTLVLKTEKRHYIDPKTYTVKDRKKQILYATLSGYEFTVPKKEYKRTGLGQINGKGRSLVGILESAPRNDG